MSDAPNEVEVKARSMGWHPREEYRGDPEKFVDAQEFLDNGERVLPIIRSQNRKLETEVSALRSTLAEKDAAISSLSTSIEELKKFQQEEVKRQVKEERARLKAEIREARQEGDDKRVDQLELELEEVKEPTPAPPAPKTPQSQPLTPEFLAWKGENPWFETDLRKTALAIGIATDLRRTSPSLTGAAFFAKVSEELNSYFAPPPAPPKSEGGSSRGANGSGGGGKGFRDLPAEAKATAERQAVKFVGPSKAFKTKDEWNAHYARIYFSDQE